MNIRKSGVYGDSKSAAGLYEGVPVGLLTRRSWYWFDTDFHNSYGDNGFTTANSDIWNNTEVGTSGTAAILATGAASHGGVLRLSSTTINEGYGSIQTTGAGGGGGNPIFVPIAGRTIVFEALMTMVNWDDCDWFAGLTIVDSTVLGADGTIQTGAASDHIGFHSLVTETSPRMAYNGGGGTAVRTATGLIYDTNLVNSTYYGFGVRLFGLSTAEFYISTRTTGTTEPGGVEWNTKMLSRVTLPAALTAASLMVPTFGFISNANAITMDIDRVVVAATR